MLHKGVLFLLLGCIAIFASDAIAGAYYEDSYQEYRPRRSYRKSYSPQPRHSNYSRYSRQGYSPNKTYKKRRARQYRPLSSYKTNFLPERMYIGTSLGHTIPLGFESSDRSLNNSPGGVVYGLLAGVDIYDWLRAGIDITHLRKHRVKGNNSSIEAEVQSTSIMLNKYYTLPHYIIKPYVLMGLGISWNAISNYRATGLDQVYPNDTKASFAYQTGAGLSFPYKNFVLDGEAKYVNKGKAQTKANAYDEQHISVLLKDFTFSISLRYYFNDSKP